MPVTGDVVAAHGLVARGAAGLFAGGRLLAAAHRSASTGSAAATGAQTVSAGHLALQLFIGVAVVVVIVAVASRLVKGRGRGAGGAVTGRRGLVKILGRQVLGKGVSVAVVEVAGRAYLLGVTPQAVRRLGEADAEAVRQAAEEQAQSPVGAAALAIAVRDGLARANSRLATRRAARSESLGPGARRRTRTQVIEVASAAGSSGATVTKIQRSGPGKGSVRATTSGARPAPTWTSAIEHLRERTVRRA